jgi:fluoride exporter
LSRLWQVVLAALTSSPREAPNRNGSLDKPTDPETSENSVVARVSATAGDRKERPGSGWVGPVRKWMFPVVRHKMILLFVGGGLGTIARYLLSKWFNEQPWGQGFPWGTFAINVSGSFILGAAAVVVLERLSPAHQNWYLLLGTGFCGGYTTFSTFEWETYKLVRDGSWWYALANVLGSVLAGFIGILLAVAIVNGIFPKR